MGLDYNSRARKPHRAVYIIIDERSGEFPHTPKQLAAPPGIGRLTVLAIALVAFGARSAILDGNFKLVIARCYGVHGCSARKIVEEALWERVSGLLPCAGVEAYTQGLKDFDATLNTVAKPNCVACLLLNECLVYREDRVEELPNSKPKKPVPQSFLQCSCFGEGVMCCWKNAYLPVSAAVCGAYRSSTP